jgi:hypothetical protein
MAKICFRVILPVLPSTEIYPLAIRVAYKTCLFQIIAIAGEMLYSLLF